MKMYSLNAFTITKARLKQLRILTQILRIIGQSKEIKRRVLMKINAKNKRNRDRNK